MQPQRDIGSPALPSTLISRDKTPAGGLRNEWSLVFPSETISVRELNRERVHQEVQDHNIQQKAGPY